MVALICIIAEPDPVSTWAYRRTISLRTSTVSSWLVAQSMISSILVR
jgi:hypothetical protein